MGVKVDLSPYGKNIQKVFERHLPEENTWIQDTDSETRMEKKLRNKHAYNEASSTHMKMRYIM
jgi:hypothetical protein